jgi:hypothetical protein
MSIAATDFSAAVLPYHQPAPSIRLVRLLARSSNALGLLVLAHPIIWNLFAYLVLEYLRVPRDRNLVALADIPVNAMPLVLVCILGPAGIALGATALCKGATIRSCGFGILASLVGSILTALLLLG